MKKLWLWCKSEAVLCIALLLALFSMFWVHPDKKYIGYIDFRTLAILFCLMAVMAGLQKIGLFKFVAECMLSKVKHIRGVFAVLVMLCFFSSMFITNDVALITFVPFTFIVLKMILGNEAKTVVVPIVVMQSVAANLGSMLTPIGNPQNLYLYGKSSMTFVGFMALMLPYTLIAFVVLGLWCLLIPYKGEKQIELKIEERTKLADRKKELVIYATLFVVCILTVAHIVPYLVTLGIVAAIVFLLDRKVFADVDYSLLLTFVGFFVFIGNLGRIPAFYELLQNVIKDNEILTSVVASQFMSNVPAALLLSGFTSKYELLMIGTNLGGLGTLIASMASLISFKYIGKEYKEMRMKYVVYFTMVNILFLFLMLAFVYIS